MRAAGSPSQHLELLSSKMAGYVLSSKADNTVSKYYGGFRRWSQFITREGGCALPGQPIHVALYLTHMLDTGCSHSVLTTALYSIKWAHGISGMSDPTENCFVKSLMESSKRQDRPPRVKKNCVSTSDIIELCEKYKDETDLLVIRDLVMIVLAFAGFLRYDELRALRVRDISFQDTYLKLIIRKSKTDQYRLGDELVIVRGETVACPYRIMQKYMSLLGSTDPDYFLFMPLVRGRASCKLIHKNKALSYTRARECIVRRLREVAVNQNLGLHSLRAGGATEAANNDVNERCWKRHGRWRGDISKDGYISDSLSHRLQVTKRLGL
ncbi:uncharacterized protein LOC132545330 [Ylistrum balloti]|uniref:uncharacterized protein LOC132545330 n=1 Tax=Ylistrum balloti TaxID=509963 RepID=UPI002905A2DB|nr:uncharacterized protein LOC132545330 [Ylistrum balloti]